MMKRFSLYVLLAVVFAQAAFSFSNEILKVPSASMEKSVDVVVLVPDKYKLSKAKFPVLYLLHGFGDNHLKWAQATSIGDLADQYGVIVVCPDGGKSWYFDSPIDKSSKYETFVSRELVQYIDRNYQTNALRQSRAIAGLSMGGHGALFLAIRHQDVFGAVAALSGGVDIRPFPNNWDIAKSLGSIKEHPENWEEYTVINQAKQLKDGDLAISIDCGDEDFFIGVNRALHQQLLNQKIAHDYTERRGGHGWDYWKNSIKYQMLFFSEYFTKAVAPKKSQ